MKITRLYTQESHAQGINIYDTVKWETRTALIEGVDDKGNKTEVFRQDNVEVPASWSQTATNIVADKYFRGTKGTPEREYSVKQMISRVVTTITKAGINGGYFEPNRDMDCEVHHHLMGDGRCSCAGNRPSDIFADELTYMLLHQMMSFNSPVWFNIGVEGVPQQSSACFIVSTEDSMEGLTDQMKIEARLFKGGSGVGCNMSSVRSSKEGLKGGGKASGPVSFMKAFDANGGAVKSGGKTRRAACMRILNVTHPDIEEFVDCKVQSEKAAHILIDGGISAEFNVPGNAYDLVPYQNANHSVRVSDAFMQKVIDAKDGGDTSWTTYEVVSDLPCENIDVLKLWEKITYGAWFCGDPGIQYDDTCNEWHTTPKSGRQNGSNPCQPACATVLTPQGIRNFEDIEVGDTIWSGKDWTKVTRKVATGIKPVYYFYTRAGCFLGTEDHQIICEEQRIQARDAKKIDQCRGALVEVDLAQIQDQDIVDGWMIGDGSYHRAWCMRYLNIGANDHDIFTRFPDYVGRKIESLNDYAYAIKTTITPEEIPLTFLRSVPNRYRFGNAEKVVGFLRGLYSANGSICGGRITLKAASFTIIHQVQEMLSSIGIRSYYTINRASIVEFSNGEYDCKQSYDLNVTCDRQRFMSLIGFIQNDKQSRGLDAAAKPKRPYSKTSYEVTEKMYVGDMPVFDITVEAEEHTYWTGGVLVSNCSEYMHVDDSACNLASLNLMRFQTINGPSPIHVGSFVHSVEITILAQDILVGYSSYPTEKIGANARKFRQLGLGYANLGALLMSEGLPYDSDEGRHLAASITSLMTAAAYHQSARIAAELGAFEGFELNKDGMLYVVMKHKNTTIRPVFDQDPIMTTASEAWEAAYEMGFVTGFRNSTLTCIAPCGTIGFKMDCDTTGIEPELSLVKYKKLVGGGTLKIVNQRVQQALDFLGYPHAARHAIIKHIESTGTVEGSVLREEHLPIFDCSFKPANGERFIHHMGHVKMMAAVQPFLSMSTSKTVNLPYDATQQDVENVYIEGWKLGLKAVAVYRDGCKRTQPLNTSDKKTETVPPPLH